jgi:glycosyltransferase involved in cell wall biosynthesis
MLSNDPTVSVVVPAYNAVRTLPAALESVALQTFRDFEIVVVDDGSTDATAEVARSLGAPNLRVVSQINAGHAAARNTGIQTARGRYVAFLDADDLWLPDKLARQLAELRARPGVRALQTGAARVDDGLNMLWDEPCRDSRDALWETLCFQNMPALMSTLMVDKSLLQEVGGFDATLVILQDWDLAIRLARVGQLHSMTDVLSGYRFHPGSQSADVDVHIAPGHRVLEKQFSDPELPARIRRRRNAVYARFYTMLCGGAVKAGRLGYAGYWGCKALRCDPRMAGYILRFPARRLNRRRRTASAPDMVWPPSVLAANRSAVAVATASEATDTVLPARPDVESR